MLYLKRQLLEREPLADEVGLFSDPAVAGSFKVRADGVTRTFSTGVTPEEVQDIIGASFVDTPTINYTYDDVSNTMQADVIGKEDTGVASTLVVAHAATVDHPVATTTVKGMMSPTDKVKLDNMLAPVVLKNTTYLSSTNSATLVNISSLQFDVVNGKHYKFNLILPYSVAATATGITVALGTLGGASGQLTAEIKAFTSGTIAIHALLNAFNTTVNMNPAANTSNNYLSITGIFICYSSGQVVPQFRTRVNSSQVQIIGSGIIEVFEV